MKCRKSNLFLSGSGADSSLHQKRGAGCDSEGRRVGHVWMSHDGASRHRCGLAVQREADPACVAQLQDALWRQKVGSPYSTTKVVSRSNCPEGRWLWSGRGVITCWPSCKALNSPWFSLKMLFLSLPLTLTLTVTAPATYKVKMYLENVLPGNVI